MGGEQGREGTTLSEDDCNAIRAYTEEVLRRAGGASLTTGGGGRAPETGAAATVKVRVHPNPPTACIIVASVVASALLTKIVVLALARSATNATWCLPRAAGGTLPPLPAREVRAVDVL